MLPPFCCKHTNGVDVFSMFYERCRRNAQRHAFPNAVYGNRQTEWWCHGEAEAGRKKNTLGLNSQSCFLPFGPLPTSPRPAYLHGYVWSTFNSRWFTAHVIDQRLSQMLELKQKICEGMFYVPLVAFSSHQRMGKCWRHSEDSWRVVSQKCYWLKKNRHWFQGCECVRHQHPQFWRHWAKIEAEIWLEKEKNTQMCGSCTANTLSQKLRQRTVGSKYYHVGLTEFGPAEKALKAVTASPCCFPV